MPVKTKTFKDNKKYYSSLITKQVIEGDNVIIEGLANANVFDAWNERVEPSGGDFKRFDKNPISLFNHDRDFPIGKVLEKSISDEGLFVKIQISNSNTEKITAIRDLIKEGILKTFSIGFMIDDYEYNSKTEETIITKWSLFEVSIVTLPMNEDSTFSVSQSKNFNKNLDNKTYSEVREMICKSFKTKEDNQNDNSDDNSNEDTQLTEEQIKSAFEDCVAAKIPKLIEEGKSQEQAIAIAISICQEEAGKRLEITDESYIKWTEIAKGCKPKENTEENKNLKTKTEMQPAPTVQNENPGIVLLQGILSTLGTISNQLITIVKMLENPPQQTENTQQITTPPPPAQNADNSGVDNIQKSIDNINRVLAEV